MTEKYLLFSLDDEESRKLGEIISNPTCKKIANFLAEKEASETDISIELRIPLNTVDYNIKKLLSAGLIEKSKNHFWSVKGKRIETYKVANKLIVISPRKSNVYSKLKGIVPVALICGLLTLLVSWYYSSSRAIALAGKKITDDISDNAGSFSTAINEAQKSLPELASSLAGNGVASNFWIWFLAGALIAMIAFLVWNWKKL
jgi:DNA-binding transcriptional ArsR family regulator